VVGRSRADPDARDARRQGVRGSRARAAALLARHRDLRARGNRYEGGWFDPAFDAGDDPDRKDDRIFDAARAEAIAAAASRAPALASETRRPSRESAPPLFDLTSLQREANRRFSWSARRTLSAAQRCYERHKVLTYPRTSSKCLPEDYRDTVAETLASFADNRRRDEGFADLAAAAARLRANGLENEARIFDNAGISDHFAIVPTGALPRESLTGDDKRLFDLVARRFLGAFHRPRSGSASSARRSPRARTSAHACARSWWPGWRSVLVDASGGRRRRCPRWSRARRRRAASQCVRSRRIASRRRPGRPRASPRPGCSH